MCNFCENPICKFKMSFKQMVESQEISYIYGLHTNVNKEVRYIGYTQEPRIRLLKHIRESKLNLYHRHKWIQKELKLGNKIEMEIIGLYPIEYISNKEIETIKLFKSFGAKLVNGNSGGIGGTKPSLEVREKLRLSKIGNTWNIGRKRSKESIEAGRLKMKGKKRTEEHNRNLAKALKGKISKARILNDETIINIFKSFNEKLSIVKISEKYKLTESTISNVLYTENCYKNIKERYKLCRIR